MLRVKYSLSDMHKAKETEKERRRERERLRERLRERESDQ